MYSNMLIIFGNSASIIFSQFIKIKFEALKNYYRKAIGR